MSIRMTCVAFQAQILTVLSNPFCSYHLEAFGPLTSNELVSYNYKPNNGLHDQHSENATLVGESIGGGLLLYLCLIFMPHKPSLIPSSFCDTSSRPMVSMSGTNLPMQLLPEQVMELTYQAIIDRLGLASLPAPHQVSTLVNVDNKKLLQALRSSDPLYPMIGGKIGVKRHTYFEICQGTAGPLNLRGRTWCAEIMTGDCQVGVRALSGQRKIDSVDSRSASILSMRLNRDKTGILSAFRESITRSLGSADKAEQVLAAYARSQKFPDDEELIAILDFANVIYFILPVLHYGHCYQSFHKYNRWIEPNPWDGPWKGSANHILDVAFLFQNYNESLSQLQREVAIQWETNDLYPPVYGGKGASTSGNVITVLAPDDRSERLKTVLTLTRSISVDDLL
ncbi:hypothetical protein F1880_001410 [Penicillium rolfsii]|nr:hypothetical protein F1880_001410 [Penicillium rolfsii]